MNDLAAISRRLGAEATRQTGRRCTVRLRDRGFMKLVDWEKGLMHWYSWEPGQPPNSPANAESFAQAVALVRSGHDLLT
jgi:hypothetical protein